ncbi:MAG: hypothetical protein ACOC1U_10200 [Spirochaetota bacterium]
MNAGGDSNQPQDRSRELIRDIQRALRRESWGRNILQLAWTAGPVTYLALQGGYLLGYGEAAPPALFIYFGVYTVIAGVVAIVVRIVYQITHGRDVERGTRILRDCLDQLPRLLLAARDEALASYSEDDARVVAAKHLLANPDASELAVSAAIRDLGGSRDLAFTFQRIEVFRRNGMPSRIAAEQPAVAVEVERLCALIESRSPETALLVRERFRGLAPSKRLGRQRTEGFIERALAAESEENDRLMSLVDVEEILTFAIEILVGRSLTLISFEFTGDRRIAESWSHLERARREFRAKLRSRNSRLRVVAELLSRRLEGVVPAMAQLRDLPDLRDDVVAAVDTWIRSLERPRLRRPSRSDLESVRKVAAAYRLLESASVHLHRAHARLLEAFERYQAIVTARASRASDPLSLAEGGGDGIRISESEIGLTEKERLGLAHELRRILVEAGMWKRESMALTPASIRGVAVEILASIEERIPLYRPEVQQAVELSRAPTIESLEPGLSADVRAGWAVALVDEVETNQSEYALRRVEQLLRFHGLQMNALSRRRVAERFNIDPEQLQSPRAAEHAPTPWARAPMRIPERSESLRALAERLGR